MNRIDREKKFQRGEKIHDIDLLSSAKREKILLLRSLSKLSNSAYIYYILYIYNSRPTCSVCIVFYVTGRGPMACLEANTRPAIIYPAQFRLSISPTVQCGEMRIIIFRATIFVAANGTCDTLSARYERAAVVPSSENATRFVSI